MKQLSEMQKNLIQCLKYLKLEEDAIVVIMLSLKEEETILCSAASHMAQRENFVVPVENTSGK